MAELMTLEAFNQLQKKLESNELYQKSKSLHKSLQYRLFSDSATGKLVDGQQLRMEDDSLLVDGMEGFDEKSAKELEEKMAKAEICCSGCRES